MLPLTSNQRVFRCSRKSCLNASSSRARIISQSGVATGHLAKELADANEAVRLASKLCKVVQSQLDASEKADKQDDSPVTVADYGAQVVVAWALSRNQGSISMVAEEDSQQLRTQAGRPMLARITSLVNSVLQEAAPGQQLSEDDVVDLIDMGASQGGPSGRHWVLDPIDGTRGFVGRRQYSVCLGLIDQGQVELGVLGCPNLPQGSIDEHTGAMGADARPRDGSAAGVLFHAVRGQGAFSEGLWPSGDAASAGAGVVQGRVRIHVDDVTPAAAARFMESFESRHSNHSVTAQVAARVGVHLPPLRMDSQVKYGLLSRGAASIFMRFPPRTYREKIWDHCPGFVIVEEAGGRVTDAAGARLDFSKGRFLELDRGIIAAPPRLHAALVQAVSEVYPTW